MLDSFNNDTRCSNNFGDSQGPLGNAVEILANEANQIPLEMYQPSYALSKTIPGGIAGQQWFPQFTTDDHIPHTC